MERWSLALERRSQALEQWSQALEGWVQDHPKGVQTWGSLQREDKERKGKLRKIRKNRGRE